MRIVFVEGVPGSGKSTMAENLCALAVKSGLNATWYLEESHNHPVHPRSRQALKSQIFSAEECLRSWSNLVEQSKGQNTLHVMEGSAFQSTVRFMMEQNQSGIEHYYRSFEDVVSALNPHMVYLRPCDVVNHSEYVCDLRGEEWSTKVSSYLAQTPYARCHALSGLSGMHQFWDKYAHRCDKLVATTSIPTKTIKFVQGEWERQMSEAASFLGLINIQTKD